jgi:putative transposase
MSRSGNVWDKAAMEGFFFSSHKTDRTARKTYHTRAVAKADMLLPAKSSYFPAQNWKALP